MSDCICGSIGAPQEIRICHIHHVYMFGDCVLSSVTQIIRETWPLKPSWDAANPAVVENARDRGIEVDALLTQWLSGNLAAIPEGTREDSKDLFLKLAQWWPFKSAKPQVLLHDREIAGTADIVPPKAVYDLKTTYDLEPTYSLQVGGYCHLYEAQYGELPEECGIIHLTKRFAEPKLVKFEVMTVVSEFRIVRDMWRLTRRLSKRRSV